jgi:fucose 4-O-acetylase-like acetyltransferase
MNRNLNIDAIKGFLIILVVLGHSIQYGFGLDYVVSEEFYDDYVFRAIYTFHMPLFMFISGYFFYNTDRRGFLYVLKTKLLYIGIPFVTYYSFWYLLWWVTSGEEKFYIIDYFRRMDVNLWFLSSLLVNCLLMSLLNRVFKKYTLGVSVLLFILMLFVDDRQLSPMFKFVFVFFLLGYYYRRFSFSLNWVINKRIVFYVLSILFLVSICVYDGDVMIYKGGYCILRDIHISLYQLQKDFVRFVIGCVTSCWFVGFALRIVKSYRIVFLFLANWGKYTLAVYGMQTIIFFIMFYLMRVLSINIPHNSLTPLLICVCVIYICGLLIRLCSYSFLSRLLFLGKN